MRSDINLKASVDNFASYLALAERERVKEFLSRRERKNTPRTMWFEAIRFAMRFSSVSLLSPT